MSLRLAAIQIICLIIEQTTTTGEMNVSMDVQEDYRLVLLFFPLAASPYGYGGGLWSHERSCLPRVR